MVWVALGALALSELLAIEAGSPDMLCPSLSATTKAVHARLGTIKTDQLGWRARYTAGHAPGSDEGDFIRLELFDPSNQLRLRRDLPSRSGSCVVLAQTIAIVLDAYFSSLAPTGESDIPTEPSSAPAVPPPAAGQQEGLKGAARNGRQIPHSRDLGARATLAPSRTAAAPAPAPTAAPPRDVGPSRFRHLLGAGVLMPIASPGRALTLSYSGSASKYQRLGLLLSWPLEKATEAVHGGAVAMSSIRGRFWYGVQGTADQYLVCVGPSLVVGLDVAEGRGLDASYKQERAMLALGLLVDATLFASEAIGIGAYGGLDFTSRMLSRRFVVEGPTQGQTAEVHAPRWWNGFVGLMLKSTLSR